MDSEARACSRSVTEKKTETEDHCTAEDPGGCSMRVLRPLACLLSSARKNAALVILNRTLEEWLLKQLWDVSVFRAVADGGVDRLLTCVDRDRDRFIPDLITGDLDSASDSALQFYREKKVPIIHTPDQDATDFTKCLTHVIQKTESLPVEQIVVVGSMGGRLDHHYANIETLHKAAALTDRPVFLISQGNAACLLPPGKTIIKADTGLEDPFCGLIPIGCRCDHVTTTGLKWNLNDQPMAFGEFISTSNTYDGNVVTVETDKPLLWTMSYRCPESRS